MENYIGQLAALGTAVCFSFGSTLFTLAGREIGSVLVNRVRLLLALILVVVIHWVAMGEPLPVHAAFSHWGWLALSGFVGFVLGDAFLFQAFVMIGPRLSMLMMALAPVIGVVLAWVFLDERLAVQELSGIGLTVGGVAWVVGRDGLRMPSEESRHYFIGLLCGLGGATGQAGGLVLSKLGLENDFPALSGNVIRLVAATLIIWAVTVFRQQVVASFRTLRANPRAVQIMTLAVLAGPVFGVWLSLVAVQKAPVGVASTLMSLTPIFLLPVGHLLFQEKISMRAILGTGLAFVGTAVLFL